MFSQFQKIIVCVFVFLGVAAMACAHDSFLGAGGPMGHAPIGVMGEHAHKTGEWMASYRYMRMDMDQNYRGTDKISVAQVHNSFMIAPTEMTMEMHMLGLMYAPTDTFTFMTMIPFVENSMDHIRRTDGRRFTTKSSGLGDVKVSGLVSLAEDDNSRWLLKLGASLPTGSVNETDATPMGPNTKLPYPMQLGSGTFDVEPALTYTHFADNWSWGAQARSTLRLGTNSEDYRLGNRYGVTSWISRQWADWLSSSVRLDAQAWKDVEWSDSQLNPMMVQTANPNLQSGERLDAFLGMNILFPKGALKGHRLAVEVGAPVYQDLNGPQLGVDWQGTIGWQKAF